MTGLYEFSSSPVVELKLYIPDTSESLKFDSVRGKPFQLIMEAVLEVWFCCFIFVIITLLPGAVDVI